MRTSGVGVDRPGAFAEYLVIPVTNVWYCDTNIPLDVIACFDVFNGLNMPHNNMAWCLTSSEDAQQHMRTYMGDYMPGYMDDHMNFVDTNGDGNTDYPMNGYMNDNMPGHMNDHMNFVVTDIDGDGDVDVEQPMNGYVGNNMGNYMGMCW